MAEYANAPNSGVKAYSEDADGNGEPEAITAYFTSGAYTYTRASVGDTNFQNMVNLAHDGIGLCRYITRNCRDGYTSKTSSITPAEGRKLPAVEQTLARLKGYWSGKNVVSGGTYNLDNKTKETLALEDKLKANGLPSGVSRRKRGAAASSPKQRIKLKSAVTASAAKPRIKLKSAASIKSARPRIKLKVK